MITRDIALNNPDILYIFTDNTDRDSGKNLIDPNSWYAKKYGSNKHYPTVTTAVLRGLPNAYPISTQHWYHYRAKGIYGNWHDYDFNEFKNVIDNEINDIEIAYNTGEYKNIVFCSPIINGKISNISLERTPILYNYLVDKLNTFCLKFMNKPFKNGK